MLPDLSSASMRLYSFCSSFLSRLAITIARELLVDQYGQLRKDVSDESGPLLTVFCPQKEECSPFGMFEVISGALDELAVQNSLAVALDILDEHPDR